MKEHRNRGLQRERESQRERSIIKHRGDRPRKREVCVSEWEKTPQKQKRETERKSVIQSREGGETVVVLVLVKDAPSQQQHK